ncbi:MAG: 1-acyl-sn-glycerol-3-phosphate acyltransferase [Proteobacteria bacterium]|nr:1-acyl-sn-glycerol-3-phosphate acyltransferase [Pseudomonadota bacterium]
MPSVISNALGFFKIAARFERNRRASDIQTAHRHLVTSVRALLERMGITYTSSGTEVFSATTPYVFVANHNSLLDALLLYAHFERDVRILAKSPLYAIPFLGDVLRQEGHIAVRRGSKRHVDACALRASVASALQDGACVLFFPEGTRSKTGQLGSFKLGAFYNAIQNNVPVVPIVIRGTFEAMPKTTLSVRPTHCTFDVLAPIFPPTEGEEKYRAQCMAAEAHERMRQKLEMPV